jgi:hypothetical protein
VTEIAASRAAAAYSRPAAFTGDLVPRKGESDADAPDDAPDHGRSRARRSANLAAVESQTCTSHPCTPRDTGRVRAMPNSAQRVAFNASGSAFTDLAGQAIP